MRTVQLRNFSSPQPELFVAVRKQLKYSRAEMAKHLVMNKSTLCRIEQGKTAPKVRQIHKLLRFRRQVAAVRPLADLPQIQHLEAQLSRSIGLDDLSTADLNYFCGLQRMKLEELNKRVKYLTNMLDSARVCSALDDVTLGALDHHLQLVKGRRKSTQDINMDEELHEFVQEELDAGQKAFDKKNRKAVRLQPWQQVELQDEIAFAQHQLDDRKARFAEIELLLTLRNCPQPEVQPETVEEPSEAEAPTESTVAVEELLESTGVKPAVHASEPCTGAHVEAVHRCAENGRAPESSTRSNRQHQRTSEIQQKHAGPPGQVRNRANYNPRLSPKAKAKPPGHNQRSVSSEPRDSSTLWSSTA